MAVDHDFDDVLQFIEDELGFSTSHYNPSYLDRRISARIRRRSGADDYREYLGILEEDEAEHEALLDSLSINVTSFYRNPEMWERLRPILRELTEDQRTVRVWSAPCSDGREPYSVAMLAIDDRETNKDRLSILGTDISTDALTAARTGEYETTRTTDIESELELLDDYSAYVDQDDNQFTVKREVRSMVEFDRHDLINDDPPGSFDLVMSRNLLIYIAPEYKEPIVDTLVQSLRPEGYLVTGMTETLPPSYRSTFEAVDKSSRIHRKVE